MTTEVCFYKKKFKVNWGTLSIPCLSWKQHVTTCQRYGSGTQKGKVLRRLLLNNYIFSKSPTIIPSSHTPRNCKILAKEPGVTFIYLKSYFKSTCHLNILSYLNISCSIQTPQNWKRDILRTLTFSFIHFITGSIIFPGLRRAGRKLF